MNKEPEVKLIKKWDKESKEGRTPPISKEDLEELFSYVSQNTKDCDNTLIHTENFLESKNLNKKAIIKWLNSRGGYCDCEVLMNVPDL